MLNPANILPDTRDGAKVAPPPHFHDAPTVASVPTVSPKPLERDEQGNILHENGILEDLTEGEMFALDALREWNRASHDPALRHRLHTWESIRHHVEQALTTGYTMETARDDWSYSDDPTDAAAVEMYEAIHTIARLFPLFAPHGSQPGGLLANTTEGGCADV